MLFTRRPYRERSGSSFLARPRKDLSQIQRAGVSADRGEALRDLSFAHPALPQLLFHVLPDRTAGARQVSRHRGLMLAQRAANLGERQALGIVAGESESI